MNSISKKYLPLFLLCFLFVALTVAFIHNASSDVLGKDESLYIFLAKGHFSYTAIDAPIGSWLDALKNGMVRTADPPGFFALLHFWEYVSFSEPWLRLLPYLFFAISAATLISIGRQIDLPPLWCVSLGFLPLCAHFIVVHSIEVRGYGLELCLTYIAIYFALKIISTIQRKDQPDRTTWLLFSGVTLAGLTSRFSFVINSFAIYLVLWLCVFNLLKQNRHKTFLMPLVTSSLISIGFFAFLFGLRIYLTTTDALNSVPPDFGMYAIPGTFSDKIGYLYKQTRLIPFVLFAGCGAVTGNLSKPIILLLLAAGVLIGFLAFRNVFRSDGILRIKKNIFPYYMFFLFPALAIGMTMVLALLGLHPFRIISRWSLFLHPAFHLAVIGIIKIAVDADMEGGIQRIYQTGLSVVIVLIALVYGYLFMTYKITFRMGGGQYTPRVIRSMIADENIKNVDIWYVSVGEANSFKYHVLYGSLKNKLSPNARIIIENRPVSVKKISAVELQSLHQNFPPGSQIVMLLGHVNPSDAGIYTDIFHRLFPAATCGPHLGSNEQICLAQ